MNKFCISILFVVCIFLTSCGKSNLNNELYQINIIPIEKNNLVVNGHNSYKFLDAPADIKFEVSIINKDYSKIDITNENEIHWSLDDEYIGSLTQDGITRVLLVLPDRISAQTNINVEYKGFKQSLELVFCEN
jgi:hypothetical protein